MAFAARKHEDGTWRLCKRMGDTFTHINQENWPKIEIRFKSQAKAKACADDLNEQVWQQYDGKTKPLADADCFWPTVEILFKHEGITGAQYKEMTQ